MAFKLHNRIVDLQSRNLFKIAQKASRILPDIYSIISEIKKKESHLNEFLELIQKTKALPEDLLNLLSLPEVPISASRGRVVVEGIVGYRGLGIETIDHHISKIIYEGVKEDRPEEIPTNISITSFMYRTPPFELTRCPYEKKNDEEITKILGARHVWLVKPIYVSDSSWRTIQNKTRGQGKNILIGSYDKIGSILQLNTLKIVDITQKCLEIEIEKPIFFLKLGSSRLEEELANLNSKVTILEKLKALEQNAFQDLGWGRSSWGIRLDYVYFCYKGLAISTDPYDLECPFRNCPLRREGICNRKRYWSATYSRRKPYPKIYPLRSVYVSAEFESIPKYRTFLPKNIVIFSAYDKRKVESKWYGIEMGTWFLRSRPIVRIYFDKDSQVGYSIPTSLVEISFNIKWLTDIIKKILENNDTVRRNVALKYILYNRLGKTLDYNNLSKVINNILQNGEEAQRFKQYYLYKRFDDNFLAFARKLLLHSLEHMLTQYVLFKLVGVDYSFILTKHYYKNAAKLFIIENAKNGGLGIIDTIIRDVENKGLAGFLLEFTNWLKIFLEEHDREFNNISNERKSKAIRLLNEVIKRFEKENPTRATRLKKMDEEVEGFRHELERANIQLDITLARTILLVSNRIPEDLIGDLEDYFDDILEKHGFLLCWDGCNGCVILERYCGEGVHQILTTSKTLLKAFIEQLRSLIVSGIAESSRRVGKVIEPLLRDAKKNIDISSPFISPRYAQELINKSREGIKVRILTWVPKASESDTDEYKYHLEALKILKENLNENLEVRVTDRLHAKIYIVDNQVAITGSANLTERGMHGNYEHIDIKLDPQSVSTIRKQFEKLWKNGQIIINN